MNTSVKLPLYGRHSSALRRQLVHRLRLFIAVVHHILSMENIAILRFIMRMHVTVLHQAPNGLPVTQLSVVRSE